MNFFRGKNNTRKNNGAFMNVGMNVASTNQVGGRRRRHRKGSRKAHRKTKKTTRRR